MSKIKMVVCVLLFSFCFAASAETYPLPTAGNDIIGRVLEVKAKPEDSLASLGLRYGMSLHEMLEANPKVKDADKLLYDGQEITVPAQFILPPFRNGIVVNMAELRLYYFTPNGKYVMTYPIAMGRDQWRTPTMTTTVVQKEVNPIWHVPESIRAYMMETRGEMLPDAVPPGPNNPLGHYALYLGQPGYLIHGNNAAKSIGRYVSSGCIRMNNSDIEQLFNLVPTGTTVRIVHYPIKVGWFNNKIYMEAQVPVELDDGPSDLNKTSLDDAVQKGLENRTANIDWEKARQVAEQHLGVPEEIGTGHSQQALQQEAQPPQAIADNIATTNHDDNLVFSQESERTHIEPSWLDANDGG